MSKEEKPIRTMQDAAMAIGVTRQTLSEWKSRGCVLKLPSGDYDLDGILAWRDENIRPRSDGKAASADVAAARARAINAQAAVLELKLRRASGELISSHEANQVLASQVLLVRKVLEDLPDRLITRIATTSEADRLRVRAACVEVMAAIIDAWSAGFDDLMLLTEAEMRQFVGSEEFQRELPDKYKWPKETREPKGAAKSKPAAKEKKSSRKSAAKT